MAPSDLGRTQAYVDPLVGSKFGAYTIVARAGAGRFGTLYRAEDANHALVTLQVLRAELIGNEHEVSAVNTLKCAGVVQVVSSGALPDGRHVRVMELLDGRSLDDDLQTTGKFAASEVIDVLAKLLEILQATHAWQLAHGRLGPSSVLRVGTQLRLIDFGFAKGAATPADDLKAVGALGFTLLTGKELEGAPPPASAAYPERLHRLLAELLEGRAESAAMARRELDWLRPAASARKPRRFIAAALLLAALAGAGVWLTRDTATHEDSPAPVQPTEPQASATPEPDAGVAAAENTEPPDAGPQRVEETPVKEPTRKKQRGEKPPARSPAPTIAALRTQLRVAEVKLHQRRPAPPDKEEGLHDLNKLRLRLAGDVTEEDRRDIAARLNAWKQSWLK